MALVGGVYRGADMSLASRYRRRFKMDVELPSWHEPLDVGMGRRNFLKGIGVVAVVPSLLTTPIAPEIAPVAKKNKSFEPNVRHGASGYVFRGGASG